MCSEEGRAACTTTHASTRNTQHVNSSCIKLCKILHIEDLTQDGIGAGSQNAVERCLHTHAHTHTRTHTYLDLGEVPGLLQVGPTQHEFVRVETRACVERVRSRDRERERERERGRDIGIVNCLKNERETRRKKKRKQKRKRIERMTERKTEQEKRVCT